MTLTWYVYFSSNDANRCRCESVFNMVVLCRLSRYWVVSDEIGETGMFGARFSIPSSRE